MEIAKRREIIWLVRILELKIRKSNNLLLFFKSEAEWYSSDQELLPHLEGCLVFDPKFNFKETLNLVSGFFGSSH